jgi:hypothetical protein
VSVTTLIDKHGVTLNLERATISVDASGFPTRSLSTTSDFATGFVQPQSSSEPVQYGREERVITHKVYLKSGVVLQSDDILVVGTRRLKVLGVLDPGLFVTSGYHMAHIVADCVEDESDDTA